MEFGIYVCFFDVYRYFILIGEERVGVMEEGERGGSFIGWCFVGDGFGIC